MINNYCDGARKLTKLQVVSSVAEVRSRKIILPPLLDYD